MLSNYIKVALRSLFRSRVNSAITIGGLSVALCVSLLILLFVIDELGYDAHHKNADRIFRLSRATSAASSAPMAPAMASLAGIERAIRIQVVPEVLVRPPSGERFTSRLFFADAAYFEIFDHRFLAGDPKTALASPEGVVLTESSAMRFFGSTDIIGQPVPTEVYGSALALMVSAVIEDTPRKSHFRFEMMGSFEVMAKASSRMSNWSSNWLHTYVLLSPNTQIGTLRANLQLFLEGQAGRELQSYQLRPIREIHLQSGVSHDIDAQGSLNTVLALSAIAFLILFIAGANFVNLSIARWARRSKEISMRRSLGAARIQLAGQFLGESTLVVLLSGVAGYGLALVSLPLFHQIAGRSLQWEMLTRSDTVLTIVIGLLGVSMLAGLYPAWVLSRVKPLHPQKGRSSRVSLQSVSVVGQFAVTVFLIVSALTIRQQVDFIQNQDLGFESEAQLVLEFDSNFLQHREDGIRATLLAAAGVKDVTFTNNVPGRGVSDFMYQPEGWDRPDQRFGFDTYFVDEAFSESMGLEVIMGRSFELGRAGDRLAFVINRSAVEALAAELGPEWENPVGRNIDFLLPGAEQWAVDRTGPIVGVVEDFNYRSLYEDISPLALQVRPRVWDTAILNVTTADLPGTMRQVEEAYMTLQTGRNFEYQFLDQQLDALYRSEEQSGRLISYFSILAIILACLGLFAQASNVAQLRQREISVRKVFGASSALLASRFTWQYAGYVLASAVVAIPASIYLLDQWLSRFAYRVDVSAGIVGTAVLATLILAAATVASQAWRVASANPAKVLRGD